MVFSATLNPPAEAEQARARVCVRVRARVAVRVREWACMRLRVWVRSAQQPFVSRAAAAPSRAQASMDELMKKVKFSSKPRLVDLCTRSRTVEQASRGSARQCGARQCSAVLGSARRCSGGSLGWLCSWRSSVCNACKRTRTRTATTCCTTARVGGCARDARDAYTRIHTHARTHTHTHTHSHAHSQAHTFTRTRALTITNHAHAHALTGRTIVFVNAISMLNRLTSILGHLGVTVQPLHSHMQQVPLPRVPLKHPQVPRE
jgi:hypothetical protein